MKILLLRHAEAELANAKGDDARRLTRRGRADAKRAARALRSRLGRLDLVAASPLTRAGETASPLAIAFGFPSVVECRELSPGTSTAAILRWVRRQAPTGTIALVGHEPGLGMFASYLLAKRRTSFLPLSKLSACLIGFESVPRPGSGVLIWRLDLDDLVARRSPVPR